MASPSPDPRSPLTARPANERLEDALALVSGDAGAAVDHANDDLAVLSRRTQRDPRVGRRELQRVLDQVDEGALELGGVDLDRRESGPAASTSTRSSSGVEHVEGAGDEPVDRPQLPSWRGRARLESRELEQVRDQPVESPHLREDRGDELFPIVAGQRVAELARAPHSRS